jgi:membrane-associated phospholipid phosphatase
MPNSLGDASLPAYMTVRTADDRRRVAARAVSWTALDWAVVLYAIFVALVAVVWAVPKWPHILAGHAALVVALLFLPSRGAAWEEPGLNESPWRSSVRRTVRFFRYTYPALLLTLFFEEVSLTVNAAAAGAPYWFETYLYNADRMLFGGVPAVMLSQAGNVVLDEVMHAFHFSYYILIIGGIIIAWNGERGDRTPGRGFQTTITCMMLGFFLSYVWYPFLPARGPWEHPEVMAGLRAFGSGWIFTPLLKLIMAGASVSGACFPSAHVSGTWALTFGLYAANRRAAVVMGVVAMGLSVACVYLRYHHAVDVFAGFAVAAVAAVVGYAVTRRSRA